jgi:hypothetical protein
MVGVYWLPASTQEEHVVFAAVYANVVGVMMKGVD